MHFISVHWSPTLTWLTEEDVLDEINQTIKPNQIKIHVAISITILPKIGLWYFWLNAFLNLTKKRILVFLSIYFFLETSQKTIHLHFNSQLSISSRVFKFVNIPFKGIFEKQILWIGSHICESYCQNINFDTILIPYFKVSEAGLRDFFGGKGFCSEHFSFMHVGWVDTCQSG